MRPNIMIALVLCLSICNSCIHQAKKAGSHRQPVNNNKRVYTYSGHCIYYKKELVPKAKYIPISKGFAKAIVNETERKFYFYYNNKLVFVYFGYISKADGIESQDFTFDSDADAYISIAKKRIELNTEMEMGGQLGYQYEITNYTLH